LSAEQVRYYVEGVQPSTSPTKDFEVHFLRLTPKQAADKTRMLRRIRQVIDGRRRDQRLVSLQSMQLPTELAIAYREDEERRYAKYHEINGDLVTLKLTPKQFSSIRLYRGRHIPESMFRKLNGESMQREGPAVKSRSGGQPEFAGQTS
jgi:hypothetical protein